MSNELRPIPGWDGCYQTTNDGRVWSCITHKWLRPRIDDKGYVRFALTKDGKTRSAYAHRLVALAWLSSPERPDRTQVNHIDSVRSNNHYSNLEWCSPSENVKHGWHVGGRILTPAQQRSLANRRTRQSVLSDADRSAIRERVANGEKKRAIALQLGLHPSTIGRVIYRPLRSRSATRSA